MDKSIKVVGRVGDVDPLNDGGVILDHGDGRPTLAYLVSDGEEDEYGEPTAFSLYRADILDIEADALGEHAWIKLADVAQTCGMELAELEAEARGDVHAKANAILSCAGHYGWDNFDSSPSRLNRAEAEAFAADLDSAPLANGSDD